MCRRVGRTIALALVVAVATECGSLRSSTRDGGASSDSGIPDGGPLGPGSAGVGPCGPPPQGTQLFASFASSAVAIEGVTSDGYAIFTGTGSLSYVPIAGGAHAQIDAIAGGSHPIVSGKLVIYVTALDGHPGLDGLDGNTGIGSVSAWSAAVGKGLLSTHGTFGPPGSGLLDVSSDGSQLLYFDSSDGGRTGTLIVSSIDGKTQSRLVSNVYLDLRNNTTCRPFAQFAGASILVSYCNPPALAAEAGVPAGPDGGIVDAAVVDAALAEAGAPAPGIATIDSYAAGSVVPVTLATSVQPTFAVDSGGTHVLALSASGLGVYSTADGSATQIDPMGTLGTFTSDGANVIYTSAPDSLSKRSPIAGGPIPLASHIASLLALSPDDNWVLGSLRHGSSGNEADLFLASASTAAMPVALSTAATAAVHGSPFTPDSKFALYLANTRRMSGADIGDLMLAPTSGGVPAKITSYAYAAFAATGSIVVVADNYNLGGSNGNLADIESFDATNPTVRKKLATSADANFFLTAAKDKAVYSWSCQANESAGIWIVPVQ